MSKHAVVWVSTVLYTLITLALISFVLVAVKPVIDKNRDKAIIEQSVEMLDRIDETIEQTSFVPGTVMKVEFLIKRGMLIINASNDSISWELEDSSYAYSEPGQKIVRGKKAILTKQNPAGKWFVSITLNYNYNITYNNQETSKVFIPSEIPYSIFVKNKGDNTLDFYT
ncbi:MAG: hypothetical protein QXQ82_02735 [Candidatus Pacearchaeota archaeon]